MKPAFASYGLPPCLHIAVGARNLETLEHHVGKVLSTVTSCRGRVDAVLLESRPSIPKTPNVPLWTHSIAVSAQERLHPLRQVWVHVDYAGYRKAWREFGMPDPGSDVLDHILNRKAIRLRKYAHPYLRLCPVSKQVNTSGGGVYGGEGLERDFITELQDYSEGIQEEVWKANEPALLLADPMDLTKMLNIPPGTITLDGVRDTQWLFYPAK